MILLIAALGHEGEVQRAQSVREALDGLRQRRRAALEALGPSRLKAGIDGFIQGPYALNDVDLWPFRLSADRARLRDGLEKAGVPASAGDEAESSVTVEGATTVDAAQAKALFDRRATFIDVRTVARWNLGHIPDAILLDLETDFTRANLRTRVGEDEDVVIYCEGPKCLRSLSSDIRNWTQFYMSPDTPRTRAIARSAGGSGGSTISAAVSPPGRLKAIRSPFRP